MSENVKKNNKAEKPAAKQTEKAEGKVRISEKNLAIVITAGILAVIFIAAGIVLTVQAIQKDYGFNYLKSDIGDYLQFDKSYKDFTVNVDVAKPHDIDVDVTILNMIYADKAEKPLYDGATVTSPITITAGDTVKIWYRGYLLDDEGNKIAVDGMSNFTDANPYSLGIGSNSFVPGFELGLVGVNTGDYNKFDKITSGAVNEGKVAYITYSIPKADTTTKDSEVKMQTITGVRLDLSTDIDAEYGAGFKDALMAMQVGTKANITATLEGITTTYTDVTVDFITNCEDKPIVVECYFPYDYSKTDLRNETAYFEVYVDGVIVYDCPEFTDEYLKSEIEKGDLNLTLDQLNEYEGDTLVDKYRSFATETLNGIYEDQYATLAQQAIWEYYEDILVGKKFPTYLVDEMFDYYVNELRIQYVSSGGRVFNNATYQYVTYDTFEKYIPAYLGLKSTQNWRTFVREMAENAILDRMAMFYIMRTEGILPTEEEYKAEFDRVRQEYLDEYVAQYLEYEGKTREDYTDEEYKALVDSCAEEIFGYYGEDYFFIRAYQNLFNEMIIDWPGINIVTLDERRAYPADK